MEAKIWISAVAVVMTLVGYSFYFKDIFAGKTHPHAFSWLVWASLTAIAFAGQVSDGAGVGAWVTFTTAAISFIIFFLSLSRGEKNVTKSDWANLIGAGFAIVLWIFTKEPVLSVILITIIDFLGFMPTIRKSYYKPHEETLIHYVLAGFKFLLATIALENYSLTTWLYPMSLVLANFLFVIMLTVRRKQLRVNP
jgi:chromate transport protein ChrA